MLAKYDDRRVLGSDQSSHQHIFERTQSKDTAFNYPQLKWRRTCLTGWHSIVSFRWKNEHLLGTEGQISAEATTQSGHPRKGT